MKYEEIKEKIIEDGKINSNPSLFNTKKTVYSIKYGVLSSYIKGMSQNDIFDFLNKYDDSSFELSVIASMLIGKIKDYTLAIKELKRFLKYVDNWATSDKLSQAFTISRKYDCYKDIEKLLSSKKPFTIRVGLIIILSHFLKTTSFDIIFNSIKNITCDDYYVEMGLAWLLAEMASYDSIKVIEFIKQSNFSDFVKNKSLQKMRESFKISQDIKLLTKQKDM